MSKAALFSIAACSVLAVVSPASASVLAFDDLGTGPNFFLSNYNGFQFGTNTIADTAWFHTTEVSPFYKPNSGSGYISTDFTLYNGAANEDTQPITNATAFVFNGAYFSGFDGIGYQLYSGNTLVFTSAAPTQLTSTPTFIASGYGGLVNSVVVLGTQGYYALDDFTYNVSSTTDSVPEPSTWAMMLLGFGAIGFAMRRQNQTVRFNFA